MIDLRSDTVTKPTAAMRAAMAAAPVGDDQFGEDPTVNQLQERVAALLGKEAALWMPSGTMANQVALRVLTRPGDTVLVSRESHAVWSETGGGGANAGVQFTELGAGGVFTAADVLAARVPPGHIITPPTTLVEIENTHNRGGGVVFPQDEAVRVCAEARRARPRVVSRRRASLERGRGDRPRWRDARRAVRSGVGGASPRDWARPAGRCWRGRAKLIAAATRHRRMLGGAMRQVGVFAAAGAARPRPSPRPVEGRPRQRRAAGRAAGVEPAHRCSTWRRCRRTSSCSASPTARPTRPRWWRGRANAACCSLRSGRARCGR